MAGPHHSHTSGKKAGEPLQLCFFGPRRAKSPNSPQIARCFVLRVPICSVSLRLFDLASTKLQQEKTFQLIDEATSCVSTCATLQDEGF